MEPETEGISSLVVPGEHIESLIGQWHPLPPLTVSTGPQALWLEVVVKQLGCVHVRCLVPRRNDGSATWERLAGRLTPAMVATTFAGGDLLYTAFGTDWQLYEHATRRSE